MSAGGLYERVCAHARKLGYTDVAHVAGDSLAVTVRATRGECVEVAHFSSMDCAYYFTNHLGVDSRGRIWEPPHTMSSMRRCLDRVRGRIKPT